MARRQGGVVSRRQLRTAAGLTDHQVDALVARGELRRGGPRGILTVAGAPWTRDTALWTAVLATRGVLSHLSAGESWNLSVPDYHGVHVTVNRRVSAVAGSGIVVHRLVLPPRFVTDRFGLAITTRSRTVLDCLGVMAPPAARSLLDRALRVGAVRTADLQRRLDEEPQRLGNRQIAALLAELSGAAAESERVLHRLLRDAGLSGWQPNLRVRVAGQTYEIDVAFAADRVAIEVDGWAHHVDVPRFRADRRRQNALVLAGWLVLRFTWSDLVERPAHVIHTVRAALATGRGELTRISGDN